MEPSKRIYCFDSSTFIRLHKFYPIHLFPDMWDIIDELFGSQQIISHMLVFNELNPDPKSLDNLGKWIKKRKKYFYDFSQQQIILVEKIIKAFPKLIDPNCEKDQADPWLIALAIELKARPNLFETLSYFVVSEESIKSSFKIPAVCQHFGIDHLALLDFYDYYKKRQKNYS